MLCCWSRDHTLRTPTPEQEAEKVWPYKGWKITKWSRCQKEEEEEEGRSKKKKKKKGEGEGRGGGGKEEREGGGRKRGKEGEKEEEEEGGGGRGEKRRRRIINSPILWYPIWSYLIRFVPVLLWLSCPRPAFPFQRDPWHQHTSFPFFPLWDLEILPDKRNLPFGNLGTYETMFIYSLWSANHKTDFFSKFYEHITHIVKGSL